MWSGVFRFLSNTYIHNQLVIGLALALVAAFVALYRQPSRQHIYFFIGFLVLILHFEYQKHIVADLADQTLFALFEAEAHYRGRWLTKVFLYHLVPFLLWLLGWGSVVLGILNLRRRRRH